MLISKKQEHDCHESRPASMIRTSQELQTPGMFSLIANSVAHKRVESYCQETPEPLGELDMTHLCALNRTARE